MDENNTQINITVTEQAVSYGDHAQDVVRAVSVDPSETVEQLAARVLVKPFPPGEPDPRKCLTIRVAVQS
jgi:hypothetical protein